MKILIIATHPDDEVLGCGGVIQKHVHQKDKVDVLIITKAIQPEWTQEYNENKQEQQSEVDQFLGISKRHNLNLDCLTLNIRMRGRFNQLIYDKIHEINPDIIYTHFNKELNNEHTLVSIATLVATRIPNTSEVYMYETSSVRFSLNTFKPNYYVNLTFEEMFRKMRAFNLYTQEVKKPPHPRSLKGIDTLAQYRGQEVGFEYAEGFIQVKRYWK